MGQEIIKNRRNEKILPSNFSSAAENTTDNGQGVLSILRDHNRLCNILYFALPNYQSNESTKETHIQTFRKFDRLPSVNYLYDWLLEVLLAKGQNKPRKPKQEMQEGVGLAKKEMKERSGSHVL